jgi:hypothetical protein
MSENVLSEATQYMLGPLMGDICPNSAFLMIATGDLTSDKFAISTGVNIPIVWEWGARSLPMQINNMIGDHEAAAAIAEYEAAKH